MSEELLDISALLEEVDGVNDTNSSAILLIEKQVDSTLAMIDKLLESEDTDSPEFRLQYCKMSNLSKASAYVRFTDFFTYFPPIFVMKNPPDFSQYAEINLKEDFIFI